MSNTPPVGIDLVQLVTIPTNDQSRSLAFYETLGFEVRADFPWRDGHRWIEVYPPGTSTGLSLIPAGPDPVGVRTGYGVIDGGCTRRISFLSGSRNQNIGV